ncbi:MAG: type II toxin-antitoxin system YafQ family toxin [Clostridiales Family XIII bacterium]|jgi:mRNA interferase YafQ|nr:type II toxin-antitoxin system YafQ family toxin [Clostridiales Family XIII bacterium]
MLKPYLSNQFKRDYDLLRRRGFDLGRLDAAIVLLLNQSLLDPKYRDHPLKGKWKEYRGLHVADDWILVYKVDGMLLGLFLTRTGTHVDVYGQ